eukprot:SAG22_NODE_1447_length_4404_cov_2.969338_6_plen_117_part_00
MYRNAYVAPASGGSDDARAPGSASAPQDPPSTSPKTLPDCLGHTSVTERGGEPRPTLTAMQGRVPAPGPESLVPQVPRASERKWRDSRYHQWQEDGQGDAPGLRASLFRLSLASLL